MTEKLSEWLERVVNKVIPDGTTLILLDSADYLELEQRIHREEKKLEAVKKLPEQWREDMYNPEIETGSQRCADQLESALGESS